MEIYKELSQKELFEELNRYVHFNIELIFSGIRIETENVIGITLSDNNIIFDGGNISINKFQKAFREDDGMYWIDVTDTHAIQIMCWE